MITKTNAIKRFFDLTSQSMQLVNQRKRSSDSIIRLNDALQAFKINDEKEMWKEDDGLKPIVQFRIDMSDDLPNQYSAFRSASGLDFNAPDPDLESLKKADDIISGTMHGCYMAELYNISLNRKFHYLDDHILRIITKYRQRRLLGRLGGLQVIHTYGLRVFNDYGRFYCAYPFENLPAAVFSEGNNQRFSIKYENGISLKHKSHIVVPNLLMFRPVASFDKERELN